jgi:20S proteasome subunit beta 7
MLSSDTLGSYGSLARYKNVTRIKPAGKHTLLGCGGDLSDFSSIMDYIQELDIGDQCYDDGRRCVQRPCENDRNLCSPLRAA